MISVDREGIFRARIIDHAVSTSKNGFPQWVADLLFTEIYDPDTDQWVECHEWEMIATGYFVLAGGNNEVTSNHQQVKEALNWPGRTVSSLNDMDLSELTVQVRVVRDNYQGKDTLKVSWLDKADANPIRQISKLDITALKELDAKYAAVFAKSASPATTKAPVKAPIKPPVNATPAETEKPAKATRRGRKPKLPAESTPPPAEPAPTASKPVPPPPTATKPTPSRAWPDECTLDEAWTAVNENVANSKDEDAIAEMWLEEIDKLGGDESAITPKQWATIRDNVDAKYGIPF